MKYYYTKTTTNTFLDRTACDLCGETIRSTNSNLQEVTISYRTGTQCSDGGSGMQHEVDMCSACFLNKLLPWLEQQIGRPVQPTEWDW